MEFSTDASGVVTGSAKLGPYDFKIKGEITRPEAPIADRGAGALPEGVYLRITVPTKSGEAEYRLQGYFLTDSNHIVGTVVAVSNDLGFQPDGTSGPFVLYPVQQ